ncbi:mitochondrial import receptor subunit tom20 [Ophidiomyces ophidiicola]|uniref:Mitochondrial import receptor subunit tom20 n=1 Tax=Ophidiomyces ophidiicola TaxID=1387563 RepID=A0ACB8UPS6_9EURO|nr:mitochondrial import receptor subunit tom20 [Ophidiomyces ophidiicola]KAI1906666.1 mitochondrial import receptor subunit tom20 [Ophidiomyces ophidiicola]KAI1906815.1 mitochondrial import receptor subunit tom20 [Ophidiomyces ophidiicola]KAI1921354.1 mitochondrial import receptor subunit tom20 [Ophidiomyces ophidiicola]KAI1938340.1 mitochondrial import receptor subunit tom20 [Ophidiomyces ophidiicola]KAI1948891.1 mitochondrial import receptor subunit tom20 [Ophidiomyces ophidiicola]
MRTSTIVAASAGTFVTALVAYAIYFDYKRQSDPEFRRALKRDNRRIARAVRQESQAEGVKQKEAIKKALQEAKEEGFPTDIEEKEGYFMSQVASGEALCADGTRNVEAALAFYKALKVYPQPKDLIAIYDRTVPKDVIEILAEMIAMDSSLKLGSFTSDIGMDSHSVE